MKEILQKVGQNRVTRDRYKMNLNIPKTNQVMFGTKSLQFYGRKIWNALQLISKLQKTLMLFNNLIKKWNSVSCSCIVCTHE